METGTILYRACIIDYDSQDAQSTGIVKFIHGQDCGNFEEFNEIPLVGATKLRHIEGAAKAVDLVLTAEELAYLEEPYVPHALVGVMAQNTASAVKKPHVWSTGNQEIKQ